MTTMEEFKETVKENVREVLAGKNLGSTPELEEYIASNEVDKILGKVLKKHKPLAIKKILHLQKDFALKKPATTEDTMNGNIITSEVNLV